MATPYYFFFKHKIAQWSISPFVLDGIVFNTTEQSMMWFKAVVHRDFETAGLILEERDPAKQKQLGRQVKNFDEEIWNQYKIECVTRSNYAKFDQNPYFRSRLFETGDSLLVEVNPIDPIWGIGLNKTDAINTPPESWPGQNLLGKILTNVRDELLVKYSNEKIELSDKIVHI